MIRKMKKYEAHQISIIEEDMNLMGKFSRGQIWLTG